jgi:hypothetical protein
MRPAETAPTVDVTAGHYFGGLSSLFENAPYPEEWKLWEIAMANRQQRGNRENKKPKKATSKSAPVTAASVWASVDKAHAGVDSKK